eukprot:PhM_4_TR11628/c1_g1_i1/m.57263
MFAFLTQKLYLDLLQLDDPFSIRCRKSVFSLSIILVPLTFATALFYGLFGAQDVIDNDWEIALFLFAPASYTIVTPCFFMYVSKRRRASNTVMTLFISFLSFVLIFEGLIGSRSLFGLTFGLMMLNVMAQTRPLALMIFFSAVPSLLITYNTTFGIEYDIRLHFGTDKLTLLGGITNGILNWVSALLVIMGVYYQTVEDRHLLQQSQRAETTARQVAKRLVLYDTQNAQLVLDEATAAGLDDDLAHAFGQIISNMDLYRPFLPAHILTNDEEEPGTEPDGEQHADGVEVAIVTMGSSLTSPNLRTPELVRRKSSSWVVENVEDVDESVVGTDVAATAHSSSTSLLGSPKSKPDSPTRNPLAASPHSSSSGPMQELRRASVLSLRKNQRVQRLKETGFRRFTASLLLIRLPWDTYVKQKNASSGDEDALSNAMHTMCQRFVSTCIETIDQWDGAIVTTTPTHILCSWNAFKTCPSHEQTAAMAAIAFHHKMVLGSFPGVRICVGTGVVHVGFVGTSSQKVPVVVGEIVDELGTLSSLCDIVNASVLVGETTARRIKPRLLCFPVDVLRYRTQENVKSTVYELVPDVPTLEGLQDFSVLCDTYNSALSSLLRGSYAEACERFRVFLEEHADACRSEQRQQVLRLARLALYFCEQPEMAPKSYSRAAHQSVWQHYESKSERTKLPFLCQTCDIEDDNDAVVGSGSSDSDGSLASRSSSLRYAPITHTQSNAEDSSVTQSNTLEDLGSPVSISLDRPPSRAGSEASFATTSMATGTELVFRAHDGVQYTRSSKVLGRGAASDVYLGMKDDGSLVALKYVNVEFDEEQT